MTWVCLVKHSLIRNLNPSRQPAKPTCARISPARPRSARSRSCEQSWAWNRNRADVKKVRLRNDTTWVGKLYCKCLGVKTKEKQINGWKIFDFFYSLYLFFYDIASNSVCLFFTQNVHLLKNAFGTRPKYIVDVVCYKDK